MSLAFGGIRFYTGILLPPAPIPLRQPSRGLRQRVPIVPGGNHGSSMKSLGLVLSRIRRTGTAGWSRLRRSGLAGNDHELFATVSLAPHGR